MPRKKSTLKSKKPTRAELEDALQVALAERDYVIDQVTAAHINLDRFTNTIAANERTVLELRAENARLRAAADALAVRDIDRSRARGMWVERIMRFWHQ